jgi:hypothetical protein
LFFQHSLIEAFSQYYYQNIYKAILVLISSGDLPCEQFFGPRGRNLFSFDDLVIRPIISGNILFFADDAMAHTVISYD